MQKLVEEARPRLLADYWGKNVLRFCFNSLGRIDALSLTYIARPTLQVGAFALAFMAP